MMHLRNISIKMLYSTQLKKLTSKSLRETLISSWQRRTSLRLLIHLRNIRAKKLTLILKKEGTLFCSRDNYSNSIRFKTDLLVSMKSSLSILKEKT